MSFVKNYDPGQIRMDLPTANYIHELPLLSFADLHGTLNLSLVFNYRMKQERGNLFNIAAGYKLNLQKRLIMENNIPKMLLEEDGKYRKYEETHLQRAYRQEDVEALIRESGLELLHVYDAFTRELPAEDSERIYYVCRRPAR